MNDELELETYLSISPNKFGIYLFDKKNLKNLYKKELVLNENSNFLNFDFLKEFLDTNIFKIEKLNGKFIENIFCIIQNNNILNLNFGIKKKNYNNHINKNHLENFLVEAKDIFKKNYQNQKLMHMIINKYVINGKSYPSIPNDLQCEHLILEFEFKSIPTNLINDLNNILGKYHIKVIKYLDGHYIKNFFKGSEIDISEMANKITNGLNENEVNIVPKNPKNYGFFEKFFQLFS
tara:strand:+ start:1672 stop:2376 length:705 start_codon:yes stop_codon:yes gene_type:complete